jgi:hypothetical protein
MADDAPHMLAVTLSAAHLGNLERFQETSGIASRDAALALLLDIAFESVTATGRRFWDRPIAAAEAPIEQARILADRLLAEGHATAAAGLRHATAGERIGHALLEGLREACQTALTTIEALDPKTQLLAEELRLEIDKRLLK